METQESINTTLCRIDRLTNNEFALWVKDESKNPTGTFKDRLAVALENQLRKISDRNQYLITCITLGNTVRSIGYYISRTFKPLDRPQILGLFPLGFSSRKIGPDTGGNYIFGGEYFRQCQAFGVRCEEVDLESRYLNKSDIQRIAANLGMKFDKHRDISYGIGEPAYAPIIMEALDEMPEAPNMLFVPVGSGVLFEDCVNLVEEYRMNTVVFGVSVIKPDSLADKIYGYYSPYYDNMKRNRIAYHSKYPRHQVIVVHDDHIRETLRVIAKEGINAEPSAAAAFVPILKKSIYKDYLPSTNNLALVINTGNGLYDITT